MSSYLSLKSITIKLFLQLDRDTYTISDTELNSICEFPNLGEDEEFDFDPP
jgi:hypothetical protein